MIRHICMFQLKEENKQAVLEEVMVRVQSLRSIEQICSFDVVCNAQGMPENNYDVALIFDFNTAEDLKIYQAHPVHKAFGAFITPLRQNRACIDYELHK